MSNKRIILNSDVAAQKLQRMALEIAEKLSGEETELVIIAINPTGNFIASAILQHLKKYADLNYSLLYLTMDENKAGEARLNEDVDLNNKNILLINDVSNTGKTLLYALKPLIAFQPKRIQLLVLVERMHKLFPVKPDYVGYSIATSYDDYVQVEEENGNIIALLKSSD